MSVAQVLRRARVFLGEHDFAPGTCSLTALGNPALVEMGVEPAAWCLDDVLMRMAGGDRELAGTAYAAISEAAGGGSGLMIWDEATGYCIDRPKKHVLRLLELAAGREAAKERRKAS